VTLTNPRVVITTPFELGYPDGMAIDAEDKLWIAMWGGSAITKWDPITGELLKTIKLPVSKPTSVAFGGPSLSDLYITSASQDVDLSQEPLAGSVFLIRNAGLGVPSHAFDG